MDPLAELVKIDAKSIGVGQYPHDVDPVSYTHLDVYKRQGHGVSVYNHACLSRSESRTES